MVMIQCYIIWKQWIGQCRPSFQWNFCFQTNYFHLGKQRKTTKVYSLDKSLAWCTISTQNCVWWLISKFFIWHVMSKLDVRDNISKLGIRCNTPYSCARCIILQYPGNCISQVSLKDASYVFFLEKLWIIINHHRKNIQPVLRYHQSLPYPMRGWTQFAYNIIRLSIFNVIFEISDISLC